MLYGYMLYATRCLQALIQDVSDFKARHEAQELQMKAHELMERAVPMASEAEIYQDVAQLMSQEGVEGVEASLIRRVAQEAGAMRAVSAHSS